jgi:hypothetical protein
MYPITLNDALTLGVSPDTFPPITSREKSRRRALMKVQERRQWFLAITWGVIILTVVLVATG